MSVTPFKRRRNRPTTAKDLLIKLRSSPRRDLLRKADQAARSHAIHKNAVSAQPIVDELAQIGITVGTIADLLSAKLDYQRAVSVLLRWLPRIDNQDVKEDIVRALSVPCAKPDAALALVEEFRRADDRGGAVLKWAIANALSVVADDSVFEAVASLARDRRHGRAREMLALALGNMANRRAADVLIELLSDDETAGHAIIALGKLRAEGAREKIRPFENHGKAWIRREAHKAIQRIEGKK